MFGMVKKKYIIHIIYIYIYVIFFPFQQVVFFCGEILHLCELKHAIVTPIKEFTNMISPKTDH